MQAKIVEMEYGFIINLEPETESESTQILRLASNAKPDNISVTAYYHQAPITGEVGFKRYADKKSSIRNTDRRK